MAQTPAQKKAVAKYQTKKFIREFATVKDAEDLVGVLVEKFGWEILVVKYGE